MKMNEPQKVEDLTCGCGHTVNKDKYFEAFGDIDPNQGACLVELMECMLEDRPLSKPLRALAFGLASADILFGYMKSIKDMKDKESYLNRLMEQPPVGKPC